MSRPIPAGEGDPPACGRVFEVRERRLSPLSQCWQPVVLCHRSSEKERQAGQQGDLGVVTLALRAFRQSFPCSGLSKASRPAPGLDLGQRGGGLGWGAHSVTGRAEEPLLEGWEGRSAWEAGR